MEKFVGIAIQTKMHDAGTAIWNCIAYFRKKCLQEKCAAQKKYFWETAEDISEGSNANFTIAPKQRKNRRKRRAMAIDEPCTKCGKMVTTTVTDSEPLCDKCRGEPKGKNWDEMTIEEKIEDLHQRFLGLSFPISDADRRIGQEP